MRVKKVSKKTRPASLSACGGYPPRNGLRAGGKKLVRFAPSDSFSAFFARHPLRSGFVTGGRGTRLATLGNLNVIPELLLSGIQFYKIYIASSRDIAPPV